MTWPEVVLPDELFSISDPQSKLPRRSLEMLAVMTTILSASQGNVSEEARDVCKKLLELLGLQDVEFLMCSIKPLSRLAWERGNWTFSPFSHPFGRGRWELGAAKERSISQTQCRTGSLVSLDAGCLASFGNLHRSPLAP